ncbi:MAG: TrmH family RNA methyltransferase [Patescibacteria group bacterium]
MKPELSLFLDNIRSVHNVGSIFRTADAVGISRIYCAGVTPTPVDRFGRTRKDFAKTALGSEKELPWEHVSDAELFLRGKKNEGVEVFVLEQTPKSHPYTEAKLSRPTILVLGNEVDGVSQQLVELADECLVIPMRGMKESLNVSVAAGIVVYHLL